MSQDLVAKFAPLRRQRSTHKELTLQLQIVTPILGGAPMLRTVDEVDAVRVTTIRGHLRFWWRALNAYRYTSQTAADDLYEAEGNIWGQTSDKSGGRSLVEVRVTVEGAVPAPDTTPVQLYGRNLTPGAYALWPARQDRENTSPRRPAGTRFVLTVRTPAEEFASVSAAMRAWVLFGGYGSRTRRGLGSLRCLKSSDGWQPEPLGHPPGRALGIDWSEPAPSSATDVPSLAGAQLLYGRPVGDAQQAWCEALNWLRDFRQGTALRAGIPSDGARQPDPHGGPRPSVSNWPEPDKIRHIHAGANGASAWSHDPSRHNSSPVWPRAGFGLPIVGQFQRTNRDNSRSNEPPDYQLRWSRRDGKPEERLASPLIVKAMHIGGNQFVPIALWLRRSYPENSEVVLVPKTGASFPAHVESRPKNAPFDKLVADGDQALFAPLRGKHSLQQAFMDWLVESRGAKAVA